MARFVFFRSELERQNSRIPSSSLRDKSAGIYHHRTLHQPRIRLVTDYHDFHCYIQCFLPKKQPLRERAIDNNRQLALLPPGKQCSVLESALPRIHADTQGVATALPKLSRSALWSAVRHLVSYGRCRTLPLRSLSVIRQPHGYPAVVHPYTFLPCPSLHRWAIDFVTNDRSESSKAENPKLAEKPRNVTMMGTPVGTRLYK